MPAPDFIARLRPAQQERRSVLCVGLVPDPERLPAAALDGHDTLAGAVAAFNAAVIEATAPAACAYKLNFAFYEALGMDAFPTLVATIAGVPEGRLVIADAKRGDIGNSARFYAETVFDLLGCDACTVSPYMGADSVAPFLQYESTATFVLARTTNPGAAALQELSVDGRPLHVHVARAVAAWDEGAPGTAGLVAGATDPEALRALREVAPALPFLIPGLGAQGGDAEAVLRAATPEGPVLVSSSRSILYASAGDDYAEAAGRAAAALRDRLNQAASFAW